MMMLAAAYPLAVLLASTTVPPPPPLTVETAPPVVIGTDPHPGDDRVDPVQREIVVHFNKRMLKDRWSWSAVSEDMRPVTTGEPAYRKGGRAWSLPVKLEPGRTYALWINTLDDGGFQDEGGRPAVPYLLVFSTSAD